MTGRILLLAFLLPLQAPGEEGTARLTVHSEPEGAHIYLDSVFAGVTPLRLDSLGGTTILRILGGNPGSWLSGMHLDTLELRPGQDTTVLYHLQSRFYLNTVPSGASLFVNDSLAGTTPLVFADTLLPMSSTLALRKEGYQEAHIGPEAFMRGSLILPLTLMPGTTGLQTPSPISVPQHNHLRLHLSGYSTLLFGLMTAYLKSRADDANDAFLRTQDPSYLARRDRLDHQAAYSIIATEIALGLFIYFLLLE